MSYILAAWFASIIYAFGAITAKLASKHHIANPWLYNFIWGMAATVLFLPVAVFNGVGLPQDWKSMLVLSVANVVSGTAYVLAFYAVDVSVIGPLANLRTPLLVLVGVFWFQEMLVPFQWILIGIIFVFGLLVNIEEKIRWKTFLNRRVALVLLFVVTSVWFNSYVKYASALNGYWEILIWPNIIGVMLMLPTWPLFSQDFKKTHWTRYKGLVISTILFFLGWMFEVAALKENISITMTIISLPISMLLAVGFSVFAPTLLEKHTVKVYAIRLISAAVMVLAAIGLSR